MFACSDFLEENPLSDISSKQFFRDRNDAYLSGADQHRTRPIDSWSFFLSGFELLLLSKYLWFCTSYTPFILLDEWYVCQVFLLESKRIQHFAYFRQGKRISFRKEIWCGHFQSGRTSILSSKLYCKRWHKTWFWTSISFFLVRRRSFNHNASLDAAGKFIFIPLIGASPVSNPETTYKESKLYFPIPIDVVKRNPSLLEPVLE